MHPSQETVSAYLDGELTPAEALSTAHHLRQCATCAAALASFAAIESGLAEAPALACEAVRTLVSARLDQELDPEGARVADAHLDDCASCQEVVSAWTRLDEAIASLPLVAPSEHIDAALERLRREPVRARRRTPFPLPAAIWPARALAAVAVIAAVLLAASQQPGTELATPGAGSAIVASVQQSVLDSRTGTLYVLRTTPPTVTALDAATLAQRQVISVGGTPTAIALNETTDQVLVLDAHAKTLTTIDSRSNSVISSTPVGVPGTPTSIQVNGAGQVAVASIIADAGSGPNATLAPQSATSQTGAVSVLDPTTKQILTVSQVDVAPSQLVMEPSGKRALLVSTAGTTIVDAATYKQLDRAPGGISAAFSGPSGEFAILTLRDGAAFVDLSGHAGVALSGAPLAITALPNGGYAVLTVSAGAGRITTLAADGTVGTTVAAPAGRDITFDPLTGNLAVIGPAGVSNVALSAVAVAPSAGSAPPTAAVAPAPASAAPQPSGAASASPATSASPAPSASPPTSPAQGGSLPPVAERPEPDSSLVPTGARLLTGSTYLYSSSQVQHPVRVAGDGTRMWSVDASNVLTSLHTDTGDVFRIATLPSDAHIDAVLPSPGYVYLTDARHGRLYVVDVQTDTLSAYPVPFLPLVADAVTSPDDRLWLVADGLGLVSFDPRAQKTEVAYVGGTRFSAVGIDAIGRVWLAPRDRGSLDVYDPLNGKLTELVFPHDGAITAIFVDAKAVVWVGTDNGQIFAMRNRNVRLVAAITRPVDRLIAGPAGDVWYVSRSGGEVTFGPADGSALALHGPLGMSTPAFDGLGRAWAEDPASGSFFVTLPGKGR